MRSLFQVFNLKQHLNRNEPLFWPVKAVNSYCQMYRQVTAGIDLPPCTEGHCTDNPFVQGHVLSPNLAKDKYLSYVILAKQHDCCLYFQPEEMLSFSQAATRMRAFFAETFLFVCPVPPVSLFLIIFCPLLSVLSINYPFLILPKNPI